MKSLRYLTTIGVLAICTVFASAQDSGLGRGHGGGSTRDKDSGSTSRSSSPPSTSSDRSSSHQDSGHSRDHSSEPSRGAPTQDSGRSHDRQSEPRQSAPPQDSSRSRDRSPEPRQPAPSRDAGRPFDRPSQPRETPTFQDSGRSRDRMSEPRQTAPPTNLQDGGLGRGRSTGNGSSSGSSSGSSRDRGNSGSGSGSSRDNGSSSRDTGSSRDNSGRDQGLGRDQALGRDNRSQGRSDTVQSQGRLHDQISRSGTVSYRSNNNIDARPSGRSTFVAPQTFGVIKSVSLADRARREDSPRHFNDLSSNGWRTGYCHYNNNWNDSFFWYPNYCFSPFGNVNIVISPWYSYSFLPGYLSCDHVYVHNYRGYWGWNTGVVYVYDSYDSGYDRISRNRELDYSIEDLRDGFERRNFRALDRLIPNYGQIAIYRDGRYDYSIDSRDFADLLNDLSSNANTDRYRILETRTSHGTARISAEHDYTDQWGNRQRVFHNIYLEDEDGKMVIREFGTSNSRVW